jgi:integrase
LLGKTDSEYAERLLDGKVVLSTRNGVFQVRLYKGNRRYAYKSLKTRDLSKARELAMRAYYEFEFRKEQNLPVEQVRFSDVLNEYERLRASQNARGTYNQSNKQNQQQTSDYMLRQIRRVNKFWHEYCGTKLIEKIDNAVLRDYVDWRRDYYRRMPANKRPKNHSLNPADKTLEWETTHL